MHLLWVQALLGLRANKLADRGPISGLKVILHLPQRVDAEISCATFQKHRGCVHTSCARKAVSSATPSRPRPPASYVRKLAPLLVGRTLKFWGFTRSVADPAPGRGRCGHSALAFLVIL
jgi:hypothetical protein